VFDETVCELDAEEEEEEEEEEGGECAGFPW
jgi:hypothetical protein